MYQIRYSDSALEDIKELRFVIRDTYKAPSTAVSYLQGLYNKIADLKIHAESLPIQSSPFFSRYGINVRRINYKKMAIIYTVHDDIIYIQRIIPASLIVN